MTTKKGFGFCKAGTSSFGYGDPGTVTPDRSKILQLADGTQGTARKIDLLTRDYVLDTVSGRFVGMDQVEQMVNLALITIRGSAIIPTFGQAFSNIKTITDNVLVKVEDEVSQALADLIRNKFISLEGVDVQVNKGRLSVTVSWRDISSGTIKETGVQI
jgi:hypothetical protein